MSSSYGRFGMKKSLPIIVSIGLIAFLAWSVDLDDVIDGLLRIGVAPVLICLALFVTNIAVVSFRLDRLLVHFGSPVGFRTALRANVAGLVSSLVMFALAGAIIGRQAVLRGLGLRVSTVAVITTYERFSITIVAGMLCVFGVVIILDAPILTSFFDQLPLWQIAIALFLSLVFGVFASRSRAELIFLGRLLTPSAARRFLEINLTTIVAQSLMLSSYVVLLWAFGFDIDLLQAFGAAAIVSFAASIPISVNGWGVREFVSVHVFGYLGFAAHDAIAMSVLYGVVSTIAVLVFLPVLTKNQTRSDEEPSIPADTRPDGIAASARDIHRPAVTLLGFAAAILVFYQLHTSVMGATISINLADPLAVVGLIVLVLSWIMERNPPVRIPTTVLVWVMAITSVIVLGFLIGVGRFGVTSWALNNRIIGWGVLLGYFALGAMLVGAVGRHGFRRLAEFIIMTAVAVILTTHGIRFLQIVLETKLVVDWNFQGFSANRNAFAFQILIATAAAIALAPTRRGTLARLIWHGIIGILLMGLWATQSKTGLLTGGVLLAVCLLCNLGDRRMLGTLVGVLGAGALLMLVTMLGTSDMTLSERLTHFGHVIGGFNQEALIQRVQGIVVGAELFMSFPVFGAGLGAFMHQTMEAGTGPLVIHSTVFWILAEFGVFGFLIVVAAPILGVIIAPRIGFARIRHDGTKIVEKPIWRSRSPRVVMVIGLAIVVAVFGLTHEIFYQRILWLSLGAALGGALAIREWREAIVPLPKGGLRVLHVITTLNRGGAERMLVELIRHGDDRMASTVGALKSGGPLVADIRRAGGRVFELGFLKYLPNPFGIWTLSRLVREEKPDIVQGWMYHGDLVATIALALSGRRSKTLLFWGVRCSELDLDRYGPALRVAVRLCTRWSRKPDCVIANSEAGKIAHIKAGYVPPRFEVIHNGVDTQKFHPMPEDRDCIRAELGLPLDHRTLIHVARVDSQKNHLGLLSAVRGVEGLSVVLVGRGTEDLPSCPGVVALGLRSDVHRLLNVADGVILSSIDGEGFPNSLAEGMASGLAPISTDVGDCATMIGDTGWVVPPGDTAALRTAVQAFVAEDDRSLSKRRVAARQRIVGRFGMERAVQAFWDQYRRARS